jgi:hypothetical protein
MKPATPFTPEDLHDLRNESGGGYGVARASLRRRVRLPQVVDVPEH